MKKIIIFILILTFVMCAKQVSAFGINIIAPDPINQGGVFEVSVVADTGEALINTAEATIMFDNQVLEFRGYRENNTVISMWVETPNEKNGKIVFSGIIPGGAGATYDAGSPNGVAPLILTRLLFYAKQSGNSSMSVIDSTLLAHDGLGTPLSNDQITESVILKIEESNKVTSENINDETKPNPFVPVLLESSLFSETPQMVAFTAVDNESGISHYEVKTSLGKWEKVESPYPARAGLFDRTLSVRAYDFNGNFTEVSILIPGSLSLRVISLGLLILLISFFWVRKLIK